MEGKERLIGDNVMRNGIRERNLEGREKEEEEKVGIIGKRSGDEIIESKRVERNESIKVKESGEDRKNIIEREFEKEKMLEKKKIEEKREKEENEIEGKIIEIEIEKGGKNKIIGKKIGEDKKGMINKVIEEDMMIDVKKWKKKEIVVRIERKVDMMLKDNIVMCKSEGIVSEEKVNGEEIMDRIEKIKKEIEERNRKREIGEVRGKDNRKNLRGKKKGERKEEKNGLKKVEFGEEVDEEEKRKNDKNEEDKKKDKDVNEEVEGCLGEREENRIGERKEVSELKGGEKKGGGGEDEEIGKNKEDDGKVENIRIMGGCWNGRFIWNGEESVIFLEGKWLESEKWMNDKKIKRLNKEKVGGDNIKGRKMKNIEKEKIENRNLERRGDG